MKNFPKIKIFCGMQAIVIESSVEGMAIIEFPLKPIICNAAKQKILSQLCNSFILA